jgi:hypothetical protein
MQALAVSAQVLRLGTGRFGGAPGAGEPFVDTVRGNLRVQIDGSSGRELSVRQVHGGS